MGNVALQLVSWIPAVHLSALYTTTELPNKLLKSRSGQVKQVRTLFATIITIERMVNMLASTVIGIVSGLYAISPVVARRPYPITATCHTDDCLREFQAPTILSEASPFCSQYLSTTISPTVVTAVSTTTTTITLARSTVTGSVFTTIKTLSTAFTTTITTGLDKLKVRAAPFPTFADCCTLAGTSGKAAKVKSACSCLLINTPPVTTSTQTQTYTTSASTVTPIITLSPTITRTTTVFTSTTYVYVGPPPGCTDLCKCSPRIQALPGVCPP
ncbi:hypothetical protein MMC31_007507 [Peltigera leucophlebia]|nr:hypothetical protein [Peltigera leucophlebia]